jgi:hypothetical protein
MLGHPRSEDLLKEKGKDSLRLLVSKKPPPPGGFRDTETIVEDLFLENSEKTWNVSYYYDLINNGASQEKSASFTGILSLS